jgi:hypothetical protein
VARVPDLAAALMITSVVALLVITSAVALMKPTNGADEWGHRRVAMATRNARLRAVEVAAAGHPPISFPCFNSRGERQ